MRWVLVVVSITVITTNATARETKKPNILFLFTDDQRPDCLGALGHPQVKTPNLDALVKSGFIFRNAYCLGSNVPAVCSPSRNMLLSGQTYFRNWPRKLAPATGPNAPDTFKAHGYYTYHHGKRGNVAVKINERFDENTYLMDQKARTSGQPGKIIADRAITFLKNRKKNDKPFFMYLAFESPHDPRVAAKEYLKLYDRDKITLPKNYLPLHPFNNGEMLVRDETLAPWPRTKEEIRKHLHEYYAVISGLDHHIGRLLKSLKERGEYDNTIIIFASDHGLAIGSHGLMGKQNLYEHTMRAPLIFTGPGIPKGESQALVYLLDIFPTLCDLTGAKTPKEIDGKSLAGIIKGKQKTVRNSLFTAYRNCQRAVRDERWKLIRYPLINKTQLFDLKTDPDEMKNLADDAKHADQVKRLMGLMKNWQKKLKDKAPLSVDKPLDPKFTPPTKTP